jgi:Mlc titration factor MtfA (ptsG expression regulator)
VQADAAHSERGRNVVFHELPHRLDLLDSTFDGTQPLHDREVRRRWTGVCQAEFDALRAGSGSPLRT